MSNPIIPSPEHSDAYPSPYDLPKLIWDKIESYFHKYRVEVRESKPQSGVEGPVIVWDILSRVPGRDNSSAHGRGPSHSSFRTITVDGKVIEELFQIHTVTYRYKIYSVSSEIANQIAWDLERLLPQGAGIAGRQDNIPGIQLNFLRQTSQEEDRTSMTQDDLVVRNLLFTGQVPVFYRRELPTMRALMVHTHVGRVLTSTGRQTRSSSDSDYYIDVDSGQTVVGIFAVFKLACATVQEDSCLTPGADYKVLKDDNGTLYIQWDDTYGNVPALGQDFRVEYFVSATRTTYPDLTQPPSI